MLLVINMKGGIILDIEKIYTLYFKDVYRFIYSLSKNKSIAEDITGDTFLKALKNIDKFDGEKDIKAWLFTIAKNSYYTYYNRQKKFSSYEIREENDINSENILEDLISKEESLNILKIIHNIDEPYKEVFMLRFFGDLDYSSISSIFKKSESWARVTYYRAKKLILTKMEESENE